MAITTVVLLRGTVRQEGWQTEALEGGTLVKTSIRFDLEPEDLAAALSARLTAVLDSQEDPRGVFILPEVAWSAAREGKTYDGAIEAVGDGGSWIKPLAAPEALEDRPLGMDGILAQAFSGRPVDPAMLRQLLGAPADDEEEDDGPLDADDEEDGNAIDLGALMSSPLIQQMMAQMADALAQSPDARRELEGAGKGGALDMDALAKSPAIAKLIEGFGQKLGSDPAALASLFSGENDDDE